MSSSIRVWSAGSTRSAGPSQRSGVVHRKFFAHPEIPRCPCGAAKLRCDDCGAVYCRAPGHARHACGVVAVLVLAQLALPEVPTRAESRRRRPPAAELVTRALKKAGRLGLLCEEIAHHTHLPASSVTARVGEMVRSGAVVLVDWRETSTGRKAWAFALPEHFTTPELIALAYVSGRYLEARGRLVPDKAIADAFAPLIEAHGILGT